MNGQKPRHVVFDPTPEIFATDSSGNFFFPLQAAGESQLQTDGYDEMRLIVSLWHPSNNRTIDLDRAYVEFRANFHPDEEHWMQLAEIEPVVPPYNPGERYDGWIILPIFGTTSRFGLFGSGFQRRARLQIRTSAYFVA